MAPKRTTPTSPKTKNRSKNTPRKSTNGKAKSKASPKKKTTRSRKKPSDTIDQDAPTRLDSPKTSAPKKSSKRKRSPKRSKQEEQARNRQKQELLKRTSLGNQADSAKSARKKSTRKQPKTPSSKRAKKSPTHKAKGKTSGQQKRPNQREPELSGSWIPLDTFLACVAITFVFAMILGIAGLNKWSSKHSKSEFGLFEITHLPDRLQAFWLYAKHHVSPPSQHRVSVGYEREIQSLGLRYKLSPHLLKAMIRVGSEFDRFRTSRNGAIGLMQIHPKNAKRVRIKGNLYRPLPNLRAGTAYFALLRKRKRTRKRTLLAYYKQNYLFSSKQKKQRNQLVDAVLEAYRNYKQHPGHEIQMAAQRAKSEKNKRRSKSWKQKLSGHLKQLQKAGIRSIRSLSKGNEPKNKHP